jgi:hypothetical protein
MVGLLQKLGLAGFSAPSAGLARKRRVVTYCAGVADFIKNVVLYAQIKSQRIGSVFDIDCFIITICDVEATAFEPNDGDGLTVGIFANTEFYCEQLRTRATAGKPMRRSVLAKIPELICL